MSQHRFPASHAGSREHVGPGRSALVVGGGIAGCAAATVLAERGVDVVVIEREPVLGGRLSAWSDTLETGDAVTMERGFHAFFRQYYNLRRWLQRVDPELERLVPLEDYPIFAPDGRSASFTGLPTTTPLNLVEVVRRTPELRSIKALLGIDRWRALEMLRFEPERTYREWDERTAADYFDGLGFPAESRALLFDVFAHSFFNPEATMSAGELLMMFHFYFFGNPDGLVFDVLRGTFEEAVWTPMRRYLEALGVRFELGRSVEAIARTDDGWAVATDQGTLDAASIVLATSVRPLQAIVAASPDLDDTAWRRRVDGLDVTLPFAVLRAWTPTEARPDREPFVGTAGGGLLDNISLYHLFQDEARAWVDTNGGSVVELHAYAVPDGMDEAEVRNRLWDEFVGFYPEFAGAELLDERFLLRRDCPAFDAGSWRGRPGVETPFGGIALAGDLVQLPFPSALMERACASGFMAANAILEPWAGRPEPIYTVALHGVAAKLPFPKLVERVLSVG